MRTHSYGDHPDQVVDLRGEAPYVLVVHGGFWRSPYGRDWMDPFCDALLEAGHATANIEYRRLGPGRYRELLEDVAAAARSVDADVAVGHSAGGHLALWLASRGLVPAAVSLGGVCDIDRAAELRIGDDAVRELLGGDDPEAFAEARIPLASTHVLVHGTLDDRVPVELARSYAGRSGCTLVELEGTGHFEVIDPGYERFGEIIDAVARARPRPR